MAAVYTNKSPVANVRCRRRRDVCKITLDTHPDVHRNLRTDIVIAFSSAHIVVCFCVRIYNAERSMYARV